MVCKETEAQYALAPLLGAVRESSHHPHQEHPLKPPKTTAAAAPDPLEPAFLAFLNDTVLNSFDGGEHSPLISPGGGNAAAHHMARAHSGGGSDLLIDMDRAAAAAAAGNRQRRPTTAAAAAPWDAAPADAPAAMFDHQPHHQTPAQRVLVVAKRGYESPEDDTASADTMPMPNKRRRGGIAAGAAAGAAGAPLGGVTAASDDAEVTSPGGPNDLVELPSDGANAAAGAAGGAAAIGSPNNNAAAAAAAAEAEGIFKAVLVAKVLTKSDASSKRVILPRIAIEANLPHLTAPGGGGGAHGQGRCMHFPAMDRFGYTHQLVIKAWANGANPKPVYVLEGVGELIKVHRLGPGDVIGVLASKEGRYFVHWNTPQTRDAAARPTLSTFEFAQHEAREAEAAAAAAAAAEQAEQQQQAAAAAPAAPAPPAAAAPALLEAAGSHTSALPAALALAAAAVAAPAAVTPAAQDPTSVILPPPAPLMTAIPVTSAPLLAGHYLPTSPCEMLVMGAAPAAPAASGPSYLRLDHGGDGVHEWTEPAPTAGAGGGSSGAFGGESAATATAGALFPGLPMLLGLAPAAPPAPAAERVGGIVHQAGALLCPRTAGCTRPAGHQGWCQGHKGHNKSQRRR